MDKLEELIKILERKTHNWEKFNPEISGSPVGWHIEHSLLAVNNIITALQNSDPENYIWKFNPTRVLVMTLNKIPRGKAKAPKSVQPEDSITIEILNAHINKTFE